MTGIENPGAVGVSALATSILLQLLKNSKAVPWISRNTSQINLALSAICAFLTSLSIHFTFNQASDTFAITGSVDAIRHGLWDFVVQMMANHGTYKAFVVPAETLGEIRALLERALTPPPISEGEAKAQKGPVA